MSPESASAFDLNDFDREAQAVTLTEFPEMAERLAEGFCPPLTCHHRVPFGRLACPAHWSQLPLQLRRNILHAFVELTGEWGSDPNPAPTRTGAP